MNSKRLTEKTTKKIVESVQAGTIDPEWGRVSFVVKRFQVGRTVAFRNIAAGNWKSVLLRDKGRKHGIRLVYIPSVRDHLNQLLAEQAN